MVGGWLTLTGAVLVGRRQPGRLAPTVMALLVGSLLPVIFQRRLRDLLANRTRYRQIATPCRVPAA
ncbi:hypothetical protein [Frankia sp. R82]|uniref:hypothetical protein n=1 Tax=Frankia sp. R82 TaxID=2950553 RepID=UPI0020436273|nr:hypothetical protein [Frankia sp. R82]MCM3884876.1 hypothetical protein [Frankia sp. R82]